MSGGDEVSEVDESLGVVSKAAHSWGYSLHDSSDLIAFFDEPEGLRVWVLSYGDVVNGRARRAEMAYTIPIEAVPSLIRALIRFSTEGAIAKEAERQGYKL